MATGRDISATLLSMASTRAPSICEASSRRTPQRVAILEPASEVRTPARFRPCAKSADSARGWRHATCKAAGRPAVRRAGGSKRRDQMAMNGHDVSILSEDASLSGRISGQDLTILGGFEGDVSVRGHLRVGPNARVKA